MREIVHIQAGQCGNQIGAKVSAIFLRKGITKCDTMSDKKWPEKRFLDADEDSIEFHRRAEEKNKKTIEFHWGWPSVCEADFHVSPRKRLQFEPSAAKSTRNRNFP